MRLYTRQDLWKIEVIIIIIICPTCARVNIHPCEILGSLHSIEENQKSEMLPR
jgi:hypothetical protein